MAPQHQQIDTTPSVSFTVNHSTLLRKPSPKAGDDEICLYPSKKCTNRRAKKKNGELHTMCEYHRIRANENQRRLERRRKAALRFPQRHVPKPTLWNRGFPEPLGLPLSVPFQLPQLPLPEPKALEPTKCHELLSHWQPIEIEILMACLFDTTEDHASTYRRPLGVNPMAHTINLAQFV